MAFGKTIKIFLIEGDPNGRMTGELSNWTGKAFKIPRSKIKDCTDRPELTSTGIYLLFGRNEEGREQVYIGEAEIILKRLNQHLSQKDFWNETIVFVSKDENLNKAHIKYLENRLFDIATEAGRYKIENSVIPTRSSISEADRAEMEEYLENVKLLVNSLGHKVFDKKREEKSLQKQQTEILSINAARGAEAFGELTSEGFLVLKGSRCSKSTVTSCPVSILKLREKLLAEGVLIDNGLTYSFTEDYIFGSPSTAAAVVMGRSANGLIEWKLKNGITLKEYESVQSM